MLVHKDAHQFGDRNRGVGVVELDRGLFGEVLQCGKIVKVPPDKILQ